MSFAVGRSSKPAGGVVTEMLRQMIHAHLPQIADAVDEGFDRGLSPDLLATHAAVIVDGRSTPGRDFLCQAGFHGAWARTEFPVLILPRADVATLLGVAKVLIAPPSPGRILVIAIGAGSETDSAGIQAMEVRCRQRIWTPE